MHPIVDLLRPYDDPAYLAEQQRFDVIRARIMAFYTVFVYGPFWGLGSRTPTMPGPSASFALSSSSWA